MPRWSEERRLKAEIEARNKCNEHVVKFTREFREFFAQFVGEKIFKADGSLTKRIETMLNKRIKDGGWEREYPNPKFKPWIVRCFSKYSLGFSVEVSYQDSDETATHVSEYAYIADMRDGVLIAIATNAYDRRCDYTYDEVIAARDSVKEAKKALADAEAKLYPFKEY